MAFALQRTRATSPKGTCAIILARPVSRIALGGAQRSGAVPLIQSKPPGVPHSPYLCSRALSHGLRGLVNSHTLRRLGAPSQRLRRWAPPHTKRPRCLAAAASHSAPPPPTPRENITEHPPQPPLRWASWWLLKSPKKTEMFDFGLAICCSWNGGLGGGRVRRSVRPSFTQSPKAAWGETKRLDKTGAACRLPLMGHPMICPGPSSPRTQRHGGAPVVSCAPSGSGSRKLQVTRQR